MYCTPDTLIVYGISHAEMQCAGNNVRCRGAQCNVCRQAAGTRARHVRCSPHALANGEGGFAPAIIVPHCTASNIISISPAQHGRTLAHVRRHDTATATTLGRRSYTMSSLFFCSHFWFYAVGRVFERGVAWRPLNICILGSRVVCTRLFGRRTEVACRK